MGFFEEAWHVVSGQTARENRERFEEAQRLINQAKQDYDDATNKLDAMRQKAEITLEHFGQYRINCLSSDISAYVSVFSSFGNLEYADNLPAVAEFNLPINNRQFVDELKLTSTNAIEVIKTNSLAAGASALAVIGTYGCAMLVGTTQAGVALSSLAGLAKAKAFIGWLGHGSMFTGGLALIGLAVIPFNIVSSLINQSKSKEALAEARKQSALAKQEICKINAGLTLLSQVTQLAENYQSFLMDFQKLFQPIIQKLNEINSRASSQIQLQQDGYIDFKALPESDRKAIHLSWIMVQIYSKLLKTPLVNDNNAVSPEATKVISAAKEQQESFMPELIELANQDTIDLPEIKEKRIWIRAKKHLTITNWILLALLLTSCVLSVLWNGFDRLIPNRNTVGFAIGLGFAACIACPLWVRGRKNASIFGRNKRTRRNVFRLLLQLIICLALVFGTYFLFGRG